MKPLEFFDKHGFDLCGHITANEDLMVLSAAVKTMRHSGPVSYLEIGTFAGLSLASAVLSGADGVGIDPYVQDDDINVFPNPQQSGKEVYRIAQENMVRVLDHAEEWMRDVLHFDLSDDSAERQWTILPVAAGKAGGFVYGNMFFVDGAKSQYLQYLQRIATHVQFSKPHLILIHDIEFPEVREQVNRFTQEQVYAGRIYYPNSYGNLCVLSNNQDLQIDLALEAKRIALTEIRLCQKTTS